MPLLTIFLLSAMAMLTGVLAIGCCLLLASFCVLSIIQLAMISSRDKVVLKYKTNILLKAVLALLSCEFLIFFANHILFSQSSICQHELNVHIKCHHSCRYSVSGGVYYIRPRNRQRPQTRLQNNKRYFILPTNRSDLSDDRTLRDGSDGRDLLKEIWW